MKWFFLLFLLPFSLLAQRDKYEVLIDQSVPRVPQVDQLKLHVELDVFPRWQRVDGVVTIVLTLKIGGLDSIWFDGQDMLFASVEVDKKEVPFVQYKKGVALFPTKAWQLGDTIQVDITYQAWPQRGMFFVGADDLSGKAKQQVWTQGQGIDNRHWVPHVDDQNDKIITSIAAIVDTGLEVISNGALIEKTKLGEKVRWLYHMQKPHSSYLMMLAIGEYDFFTEVSASGVQLTNYFYPEWEDRNTYTYYKNKEIFNFLEAEIGVPFPWQNYKQVPVLNFQHGAMENTSATIFGDFLCVDSISFNDRNYVGVNAHELAHQWFGNLVTVATSKDHWLHEGFASYYAWLAEQEIFGEERFQVLRKKSLENVAAAESQDMYPLAHGKAGSYRFYDKGAWVLFMLRNEVGEEAWQAAVKNFLNHHGYDMVTTADLQAEMEYASGKNLTTFFEQWVYRPQIPNLKLKIEEAGRDVNVVVVQKLVENQPAFNLIIPLRIVTTYGFSYGEIKTERETANYSFRLKAGEKLLAVTPDSNFELLAEWTIETKKHAHLHNASVFPNVPWYWGVKALVADPDYTASSANQLAKSNLLVRVEYAAFLADKMNNKEIISENEQAFLKAEESYDVIKSFLGKSTKLDEKSISIVVIWLSLSSYEIQQKAIILLCNSDPNRVEKYLKQLDGVYGTNGHNVRITWLELNISLFPDAENVYAFKQELSKYMSAEYDFLTRMNAMAAIEKLNLMNNAIASYAFVSLLQNNRKLKTAGRSFIVNMSEKGTSNRAYFQEMLNAMKPLYQREHFEQIQKLTGYVLQ